MVTVSQLSQLSQCSVRLFIQEQSELNKLSRTNPDSETYRESQSRNGYSIVGATAYKPTPTNIPIARSREATDTPRSRIFAAQTFHQFINTQTHKLTHTNLPIY